LKSEGIAFAGLILPSICRHYDWWHLAVAWIRFLQTPQVGVSCLQGSPKVQNTTICYGCFRTGCLRRRN
jgi:hypothetical protein